MIDACQAIVDEFYGRHSAEWLEFDYLARLLREPALETQRADEEIADAA